MVKTRRSNGENGEVEEGNYAVNDVGSVSDDKNSNWSQRELRSSQYKVSRTIQHWPAKYNRRRCTIKMPRIVFPESDTEPEKYSRRSRRQVRVFFADDNDSTNHSVKIRRGRGPRKNYMEDESEDKPIQQNVRRSCRKRKLLHHNFNESWITNELKVKGYPDLYGFPGCSSSDEFTSGEEATRNNKPSLLPNLPLPITDEDTQLTRQRRTSARFTNKKILNDNTESDFEEENNVTVIEKKPPPAPVGEETPQRQNAEVDEKPNDTVKTEQQNDSMDQNDESNQTPAKSTKRTRRQRKKKDDSQESPSESSSSEWCSVSARSPRRSTRARNNKQAFVHAPRQTRPRAKTFTLTRKKPYSLRERKPKILRRKTIRSQSPSSSSNSSSSSSDMDEDLNVSMKNKTKGRQKSKSTDEKKTDRALREIQPVELDGSVRFTSVGGLEEHIKCLREMVLFPLMYPDLFQKFKTRPAKGVLFHGPPGTGKTLLARALANECSMVGGKKVAFFMRKGADCLKKWVGESERHLKLLFQQANKMKPSIIFFDEIDALAPVRSVRQEQVHTSVVGTLLAEMDGLCDRGEVIVIGATNRLDAVEPALRRAGRFDRELYFPPPAAAARAAILRLHTQHWAPPLLPRAVEHVAQLTAGYGGSDLKALCSEAVLKAFRRVYPQVYESEYALLINTQNVSVLEQDLLSAARSLVSGAARVAPPPARPLPAAAAPLLRDQLTAIRTLLQHTYIHTRSDPSLSGPVLLVAGPCADSLLAPAVLAALEPCSVKELSVATLHDAHTFTQEQALLSVFSECRRSDGGCVLFVREVAAVWRALAAGAGGALLLQLWRARAAGAHTLLLATTPHAPADLPVELQNLFPAYKNCVYNVREPSASEVISFLKPVITEAPLQPPPVISDEPPPPLPRAPPPPPPRESEAEIARRKRKEDYKLRELRIFLRDICRKLASNRRFYKFTKPVDLEEVTDYLDIVKQPMDLETIMTKVDLHKYYCAKEFLDDVDLICANALEYNPDRTSSDKQIRHEACSLRDHAHALIDVEMDSEFEDECRLLARARRARPGPDPDLPAFIYTTSHGAYDLNASECKITDASQNGDKSEPHSAKRKRRRMNAWSKGLVIKRQKTTPKSISKEGQQAITTDEECKENKPVTSTPLVGSASSSEDEPLRLPATPAARPAPAGPAPAEPPHAHLPRDNHLDSTTKSSEKMKSSPKKRNSGHDSGRGDAERVIINKTELENIVYKNAKALRCIGLEALLDLHTQLTTAVNAYADTFERSKLPQELHAIVQRYLQLT